MFQCPLSWQNKWEGPEDPMQYLRAVVSRALAIQVNKHMLLIQRSWNVFGLLQVFLSLFSRAYGSVMILECGNSTKETCRVCLGCTWPYKCLAYFPAVIGPCRAIIWPHESLEMFACTATGLPSGSADAACVEASVVVFRVSECDSVTHLMIWGFFHAFMGFTLFCASDKSALWIAALA